MSSAPTSAIDSLLGGIRPCPFSEVQLPSACRWDIHLRLLISENYVAFARLFSLHSRFSPVVSDTLVPSRWFLSQDVPDVKGDRKFNIPSYSVVLGEVRLFAFSRRLLTALLWSTAAALGVGAKAAAEASLPWTAASR